MLTARRSGFTLLELLVAVTIIGALTALVLPRFTRVKHYAYSDAVANDLRNLVTAQEILFANESRYATDVADASLDFTTSDKVNITIQYVMADNSWLATGTYISWPETQCAVAMGRFVPVGYQGHRVECADPP